MLSKSKPMKCGPELCQVVAFPDEQHVLTSGEVTGLS